MSKEELLLKKKEEVATIARGKGITLSVGSKRKTKEQLVDEILKSETDVKVPEVNTESVDDDEDWKLPENENPTTEEVKKEPEVVKENEVEVKETEEQRQQKKRSYIENVKIGTLVAFNSYTGKVKSAKVIKRSTKNRKLKVVTKYGAEFIISYDDVIWVRTNKRWPKGVYQLLKGVVNNEEVKE